MRRLLLVLVALALVLAPIADSWMAADVAVIVAEAARQTNGADQCLSTASGIDLSGSDLGAVQIWLWVDDLTGNGDNLALEYTTNTNTQGGLYVDPNSSSTRFGFQVTDATDLNSEARSFTRPTSGAWHHYVFNYDITQAGGGQITAIYKDNSSQSLTTDVNTNLVHGLAANKTLYLMSRACSSLWLAGRIAEVALWTGAILSGAEVAALYNSGSGAAADTVTTGATLAYYWRLCGTASPEPATTGGVNMAVTGATAATHPIATCAAPRVRHRVPQQ